MTSALQLRELFRCQIEGEGTAFVADGQLQHVAVLGRALAASATGHFGDLEVVGKADGANGPAIARHVDHPGPEAELEAHVAGDELRRPAALAITPTRFEAGLMPRRRRTEHRVAQAADLASFPLPDCGRPFATHGQDFRRSKGENAVEKLVRQVACVGGEYQVYSILLAPDFGPIRTARGVGVSDVKPAVYRKGIGVDVAIIVTERTVHADADCAESSAASSPSFTQVVPLDIQCSTRSKISQHEDIPFGSKRLGRAVRDAHVNDEERSPTGYVLSECVCSDFAGDDRISDQTTEPYSRHYRLDPNPRYFFKSPECRSGHDAHSLPLRRAA